MAENLPVRAVALPAVSGPPSPAEWDAMKQQASMIARSGLAPKQVNTPEKVLVIAMKGRELAIPPMQALSHIHIVEGKPTMSAELMAALVRRAGHKLRIVESTPETCTVEGVRSDDPDHPQQVTWTMEDAKRAGVASKTNWKNYPTAMLLARAISALCRFLFADVLMGASYTPEELGAEVNEDGEVLDANGTGVQESETRSTESEVEDPEPDIEDAEVVEDQAEAVDQAAKVSNDQLRALRDAARELYGQDGIRELQKKIGKQLHLLSATGADNLLEQLEVAIRAQGSSAGEDSGSGDIDLDEDDVAEVEDMTNGRSGSPAEEAAESRAGRPARKSQVDLLKTLAIELRGEDGVAKLEEKIGKSLEELTRAEAEDWISTLTPEEA